MSGQVLGGFTSILRVTRDSVREVAEYKSPVEGTEPVDSKNSQILVKLWNDTVKDSYIT